MTMPFLPHKNIGCMKTKQTLSVSITADAFSLTNF